MAMLLRRSVSYLEKRAKCLGKRHWNILIRPKVGQSQSKTSQEFEVVLFREIPQCLKISEKVSFNIASQTVLPYRSLLIEQKMVKKCQNWKNTNATFLVIFKHCEILGIKRYENCTIKVSGWILKPIAEFTTLKMPFCFCLLEILFQI